MNKSDKLCNVLSSNKINCNSNKKDALWSTNSVEQNIQIPNEIEICNLSFKTNVIENYKLSRYIFPKHDRGPTKAGLENIKPIQSLEYIVNLCLHRVPRDLKLVWDDLAGRDSSYPEISKIGMQSTRYDLRQRSELYKRKKDKNLYVESLRHDKKGKPRDLQRKEAKLDLAGNSDENVCTGFLPNSSQECAKLPKCY